MILNASEHTWVEQSVVAAFTEAGIIGSSGFGSPLRLKTNDDDLARDWKQQWWGNKPTPKHFDLGDSWNWALMHLNDRSNKFKIGWYFQNELLAIASAKIYMPGEDKRITNMSTAIHIMERRNRDDWFKGLTRPFFYETVRQISLVKGIADMHVLGAYYAPDQNDFDLSFGMKSDRPGSLPLEDCLYRTRKCAKPFNWAALPQYLESKKQRTQPEQPIPSI